MNRGLLAFFVLALVSWVSVQPLIAHHGIGMSYDLTRPPVTLKGTVTEFKWGNPHIVLFMDVKDDKGKVVKWAIEGASLINWAKAGYHRNVVKVGQEVTALVYLSKVKGQPSAIMAHLTLPNGETTLKYQSDVVVQRDPNRF